MALISKAVQFGDLAGTVFFYEKEGDMLPVHTHNEANNHITVVSVGSFRCTGNSAIEGKIITQGMVVDWPPNQPHGFIALSDGAKMVQLNKTCIKA